MKEEINWSEEIRSFLGFFLEAFLVIIFVQIISDKIHNNDINYIKEANLALFVGGILYFTKSINPDLNSNIRQGFAYAISGVFLTKYM